MQRTKTNIEVLSFHAVIVRFVNQFSHLLWLHHIDRKDNINTAESDILHSYS